MSAPGNGGVRPRSLVRQVLAIVLLAQVLCAVLLAAVALLNERHTRQRAFDVTLRGHSDSLLGAIQDAEDPDDNVTVDPAELRLPERDLYAVFDASGRKIGSSARADALLRGADGFRDQRIGRRPYRVYQREALRIIDRAENGGQGLRRPVTIVYAAPEEHLLHEISEATGFYLVTILLASTLTGAVVVVLLRRALRPLVDLAGAAGQLRAPALLFAPPPSVLQVRELRPLAEVLAEAVERLREAFAKEQRFVSDAAHELKTAVAVVRSTVQVLLLRPRTAEEYGAGLQRIVEDNARVEQLIGQMLRSAAVEAARPSEGDRVDLGECVREALLQMGSMAEARGVGLRCVASGEVSVRLSAQQAPVLLRNLLMNAIQHSPAGSEV